VSTDREYSVPHRLGAGTDSPPEFEAPSKDTAANATAGESALDCINEAFESGWFAHDAASINVSIERPMPPLDAGSAKNTSSSELPAFVDEHRAYRPVGIDAFASEGSVNSSLIATVPGPPLLSSIDLPFLKPEPYREREPWSSAPAVQHFLVSAAAAGHVAVGRLRQTTGFIAGHGRRVVQRRYADSRMWLRRLPNRSEVTSTLRASRRAVVGTACVASVVLAVLAYVALPSPSTASQTAASVKSEARVAVSSRPTTAPSVVPAVPAAVPDSTPVSAASPLAATSPSIADNKPAGSRVEIAPLAATTKSHKPILQPAATRAIAAASSFVGSLVVTSEPEGAEVSLNGVAQGRTPLTISNLSSGSRVVSLSLPGYERWSWSVAVVANRQTPVSVKLQAERRTGTTE
jgi:hypothetical protein